MKELKVLTGAVTEVLQILRMTETPIRCVFVVGLGERSKTVVKSKVPSTFDVEEEVAKPAEASRTGNVGR